MWLSFVQVFFAVFGVMDPVGNVPVFISLTGKLDKAAREKLATEAVIRAGIILTVFVFLGNAVLNAFHISIESFRIAGGIVLVLLGLQIMFGIVLEDDRPDADGDISVVPLAMPLIAGPGMITLAVILSKEYGYLLTLAGIAANLALTKIFFHFSGIILRMLGKKGSLAFAKVMGLILVAIGVEFIRSALGAR
ncbi:MAG TPA: MarC family protein [Candidatus Binatia bacterium]|jgi:MarC family membrane protein|nr:MarC family protein [Candidatus Binatia bacterium]